MNTFTLNDPTGTYIFIGDESEAWIAYTSDPVAYLDCMNWFEWCVNNLEQITLYV